MKKDQRNQLTLGLQAEEPAKQPRSKRLRFRGPPKGTSAPGRPAKAAAGEALLRPPLATRCGFCGERVTILEDVALCPVCSSIVARDEEDD